MNDQVSRRRYEREQRAREEAEQLLEEKSRELFEASEALSKHSEALEKAVEDRTKDLRAALEKAEAASAARSRFIATMSHEIRTPLAGLLGMIDLLALDEDNPEKQEFLENARASGTSLSRIVNDVLDFSKMEAGLFVFENERVDIRSLIKSVLVLAQAHVADQGRVIEALIDDSVPTLFLGDGTRIRQVISNLVSNAVRYSESGPIVIRAKASDHPTGALVRLEVEDRGIGIAPEKLEHLFKDFSQVSNPLTAAAQGTGLGLAISKRIVEGCGGSIGVDSTPGIGSTFWVELPVALANGKATKPIIRGKQAKEVDNSVLAGKYVLLAEDNIINQRLLLTYLDRMGIKVDLAEDGQEAVELFKPDTYDLLLLDVAMPRMDGLSAVRHLRSTWNDAQLPPIVFLTAHVMDAIEDDAAMLEVDKVLSKPIPFEQLKSELANMLENQQADGGDSDTSGGQPKTSQAIQAATALMEAQSAKDLMETFEDAKLLELLESYIADSHRLLNAIVEDQMKSNFDEVKNKAHSLKGSSMLLGITNISELAMEIERDHQKLCANVLQKLVGDARQGLRNIEDAISLG